MADAQQLYDQLVMRRDVNPHWPRQVLAVDRLLLLAYHDPAPFGPAALLSELEARMAGNPHWPAHWPAPEGLSFAETLILIATFDPEIFALLHQLGQLPVLPHIAGAFAQRQAEIAAEREAMGIVGPGEPP